MSKNLTYIIQASQLYAKNIAGSNPTWDFPYLKEKVRKKALMEAEVMEVKLSKEDISMIEKKALRGLDGEMENATFFEEKDAYQTDWLTNKKKNNKIDFIHWNAYKSYLASKPNWTEGENGTLTKLDLNTERILSKLADPNGQNVVRKGMVVGNVQSGKTANYIGLISKAADAGYKVIVVLAGMLDDLRIQTQIRIEEGFIGKNACTGELVGVGITEDLETSTKFSFTSRESDFKRQTAKTLGAYNFLTFQNTCIFVIKKNTTILKNLNEWLKTELKNNSLSKAEGSLLLIDDEADNASINTKADKPYLNKKVKNKEYDPDEYNPSKINGQIRKLIQKFNICTYVGYTATPFANIFISPLDKKSMYSGDLFPKHFIQYIKPPSIYFGPSKIFLEKKYPKLFKYIPLEEINGIIEPCIPKTHKKDFRLEGLPKSLKDAIHSFLIATSIRTIREGGGDFHSSMLVNPSTFTNVQISVKSKIQEYIEILNNQLGRHGVKNSWIIPEIKETWINDYENLHELHNWELVLKTIKGLIEDIEVVVVNKSKKSEKLNYEKYEKTKRKIIVVGGFSLSRGLTLEGLITSYYLRYSKMYDSMLQMGRWFGYRIDYEDICRLYLSKESHDDFEVISSALEELCFKFEEMQALNATPKEFGFQVRADATNKRLAITARNKMGSAQKTKTSYTYSGRLVQNYCFDRNKVSDNLKAVDVFHSKLKNNYLGNRLNDSKYYVFRDIDGSLVFDLLKDYQISELNCTITKDTLLKYLKERIEQYELKKWHVIFDSNIKDGKNGFHNSCGVQIRRVGRNVSTKTGEGGEIDLKKTIFLTNPGSRAICSPNIAEEAFTAAERNFPKDPSLSKKMFGLILANKYKTPVLIIALCKPKFNPEVTEKNPESIKKQIESISTVASINFLFPVSAKAEDLVEVYENADITDLYGNKDSYLEDGDD